MQFLHTYARTHGEGYLHSLGIRKQQWDRRSQYYSVIRAASGNRMPFYVKFPRLSEYFEKLEPDHPWAKHRLGKYNGLYYVPVDPHTTGFSIDKVTFGDTDLRAEFFNSPVYKLLAKGFQKVYLKLDISEARVVKLISEDFNFAKDDPNLKELGEYKLILQTGYGYVTIIYLVLNVQVSKPAQSGL